jgi:hypothetical protein
MTLASIGDRSVARDLLDGRQSPMFVREDTINMA